MHAEPFKRSRFVDLFTIKNKYSASTKPDMHCYHTILKHSENCVTDEYVAYLILNYKKLEFSTLNLRYILGFKSGWICQIQVGIW